MSTVRLYLPQPLQAGSELSLPPESARHVQVLRLQPGDTLRLFNGEGGEWQARVLQMGRKEVDVAIEAHVPGDRELPVAVTLAVGMPANERMDALVEKATELGVHRIQPLQCARSVLRLSGERAQRRQAHWQGVAVAAAEQSGRTRVPEVAEVADLGRWLAALDEADLPGARVLSLGSDAQPLAQAGLPLQGPVLLLSGPEGGLDPREEELARARGLRPMGLGPRVLRADTAPLAALAWLGLRGG